MAFATIPCELLICRQALQCAIFVSYGNTPITCNKVEDTKLSHAFFIKPPHSTHPTLQKNIAYTDKGESFYHLLIVLNCEFVIYPPAQPIYFKLHILRCLATFLSSIPKLDYIYFMHDLS